MNRDFLEREYVADIAALRLEFQKVQRTPVGYRKWFESHSFLTDTDHAHIAGVAVRTVYDWRRMAGLTKSKKHPPCRRVVQIPTLKAPRDWITTSWPEDSYKAGHSINAIGRALGRGYTSTHRLLRRRGVKFRKRDAAQQSRHQFCNRPWLLLNYIVHEASVFECARRAKVSRCTMTNWLVRFGFRIRSASEQLSLNGANLGSKSGNGLEAMRRRKVRQGKAS